MKNSLPDVHKAVAVCYLVMLCFGARGLYNWTISQDQDSVIFQKRQASQRLWRKMAYLGLEEPALSLEKAVITASGVVPDHVPQSYEDRLASILKRRKAHRLEQGESAPDHSSDDRNPPQSDRSPKSTAKSQQEDQRLALDTVWQFWQDLQAHHDQLWLEEDQLVGWILATQAQLKSQIARQQSLAFQRQGIEDRLQELQDVLLAADSDLSKESSDSPKATASTASLSQALGLVVNLATGVDIELSSVAMAPEVVSAAALPKSPQKAWDTGVKIAMNQSKSLIKPSSGLAFESSAQPTSVGSPTHSSPSKVLSGKVTSETKKQILAMFQQPKYFERRKGLVLEVEGRHKGLKLLLVGDSLMHGIGPLVARQLTREHVGLATVHAQISSGLSRPDFFDWPLELAKNFAKEHYDMTVVFMGANDGQSMVDHGKILRYGTPQWVAAYKKRLGALMALGCQGADHVLWLGLPPMRSGLLQAKVKNLNALASTVAAELSCVKYQSIDSVVGNAQGGFTTYLNVAKKHRRIRLGDGVHLSQVGGALVADLVDRELKRRFQALQPQIY